MGLRQYPWAGGEGGPADANEVTQKKNYDKTQHENTRISRRKTTILNVRTKHMNQYIQMCQIEMSTSVRNIR